MNVLDLDALATLDLGLDDEGREIVGLVRSFAERDLAPVAQQLEHDNIYPHDQVATARELGLFGLTIPTDHGGTATGHKVLACVFEEISRAIASGSSSWQTAMPPPRRRSHHHSALTPVKFSCTSIVALSARNWLRYSGMAPYYNRNRSPAAETASLPAREKGAFYNAEGLRGVPGGARKRERCC